ncbi:hypothetical protein DIPPA_08288 [Diplonema papillatum]|nr:hypothetical protein DIPPA_08288 [Diplonema papillatum]
MTSPITLPEPFHGGPRSSPLVPGSADDVVWVGEGEPRQDEPNRVVYRAYKNGGLEVGVADDVLIQAKYLLPAAGDGSREGQGTPHTRYECARIWALYESKATREKVALVRRWTSCSDPHFAENPQDVIHEKELLFDLNAEGAEIEVPLTSIAQKATVRALATGQLSYDTGIYPEPAPVHEIVNASVGISGGSKGDKGWICCWSCYLSDPNNYLTFREWDEGRPGEMIDDAMDVPRRAKFELGCENSGLRAGQTGFASISREEPEPDAASADKPAAAAAAAPGGDAEDSTTVRDAADNVSEVIGVLEDDGNENQLPAAHGDRDEAEETETLEPPEQPEDEDTTTLAQTSQDRPPHLPLPSEALVELSQAAAGNLPAHDAAQQQAALLLLSAILNIPPPPPPPPAPAAEPPPEHTPSVTPPPPGRGKLSFPQGQCDTLSPPPADDDAATARAVARFVAAGGLKQAPAQAGRQQQQQHQQKQEKLLRDVVAFNAIFRKKRLRSASQHQMLTCRVPDKKSRRLKQREPPPEHTPSVTPPPPGRGKLSFPQGQCDILSPPPVDDDAATARAVARFVAAGGLKQASVQAGRQQQQQHQEKQEKLLRDVVAFNAIFRKKRLRSASQHQTLTCRVPDKKSRRLKQPAPAAEPPPEHKTPPVTPPPPGRGKLSFPQGQCDTLSPPPVDDDAATARAVARFVAAGGLKQAPAQAGRQQQQHQEKQEKLLRDVVAFNAIFRKKRLRSASQHQTLTCRVPDKKSRRC